MAYTTDTDFLPVLEAARSRSRCQFWCPPGLADGFPHASSSHGCPTWMQPWRPAVCTHLFSQGCYSDGSPPKSPHFNLVIPVRPHLQRESHPEILGVGAPTQEFLRDTVQSITAYLLDSEIVFKYWAPSNLETVCWHETCTQVLFHSGLTAWCSWRQVFFSIRPHPTPSPSSGLAGFPRTTCSVCNNYKDRYASHLTVKPGLKNKHFMEETLTFAILVKVKI